jgi:sugar lactone lactonase YvrE
VKAPSDRGACAAELVADVRNGVGESPAWCPIERGLYWTDIPGRTIWRLVPETGELRSWAVPEMVGCFAFIRTGVLLAACENGIDRIELGIDASVSTTRLASIAHPLPAMRFNDGRCDRQGRFWAGTMHTDLPAAHAVGALHRFDPRGLAGPFVEKLVTSNGMAFSPDGRTMYLADSHPTVRRVWAYDYDVDDGVPSNRRLFVDMNRHPGRPDGAAVDADGCYWVCGNDAGVVHRFTPMGRLDRSLAVPVRKPAMCAFGGDRLDTLYVTSIRPAVDDPGEPHAGGVFALVPGVQGVPEPIYTG